jgi:hypothetical protein
MDIRKIIIRCAGLLLAGQLLFFVLFNYLPLNIPTHLTGTPINITGAIIFFYVLIVLIYFEKRLLKLEPKTSIGALTLMAAIAELFAEGVVQLIRQFTYSEYNPITHLYNYLHDILMMVLLSAIIGFLIAFQLKIGKVGWLLLLIFASITVFDLIFHFLPD